MAPKRIPPPPSLFDVGMVEIEQSILPSSDDEIEEQLMNSDDEEAVEETYEEDEEEPTEYSESLKSKSGKSPPSPKVFNFPRKQKLIELAKAMENESNAAAKRAGAKRAFDQIGSNDLNLKSCKLSKKSEANVGGENKENKSGVNSLLCDEDEIALLQGLIDFKLKKGVDPYEDMGAFYEFEKAKLRVTVSKGQVMDKIRSFKEKFNIMSRQDTVYIRLHDYKVFELLRKLWGKRAGLVDDSTKSNNGSAKESGGNVNKIKAPLTKVKDGGTVSVVKEKVKSQVKVSSGDFAKMYPYLDLALEVQLETEPFQGLSVEDRRTMKEKFGANEKARELNEEFRILKMKEIELYSKKLELLNETSGILLGSLNLEE